MSNSVTTKNIITTNGDIIKNTILYSSNKVDELINHLLDSSITKEQCKLECEKLLKQNRGLLYDELDDEAEDFIHEMNFIIEELMEECD